MWSAFATFGCSHNSCAGELLRSASRHFVEMEIVTFQRKKMSGRDKATNQLKDYQKKRGPEVRTDDTSSIDQMKRGLGA